jgi:hypothetical protein
MPPPKPSPLPLSRSIQHLGVFLTTALLFWFGGIGASRPLADDATATPSFGWMSTWGHELRDVSVNAVLSYAAVCLVLFGISLGGQSNFDDQKHRDNVRRGVGVVGLVVAAATLSLTALAIAAALRNPTDIPGLVVIIPTAIVGWTLGIEVGRYVVPEHSVQLSSARKKLEDAQSRLGRLPLTARRAWSAHLSIAMAAACGAFAGAVITGQTSGAFWFVATSTFITNSVALLFLTHLFADTLTMLSRKKKYGTQFLYYLVFVFIELLVNGLILRAATSSPLTSISALLVQLALPLLFLLRPPSGRQWIVDISLAGAAARFGANNLATQVSVMTRRVDRLTQSEAQTLDETPRLPLHARVKDAVNALIG